MKRIASITFRLGATTREVPTTQLTYFYLWLGSQILNEQCEILSPAIDLIPISNDSIQRRPYVAYTLLLDAIKEIEDRSAKTNLFIIDFFSHSQGVDRAPLLIHLIKAMHAAVSRKRDSDLLFVFLLPQLPPPGDALLKELEPLLTSKQIILVDEQGICFPQQDFVSAALIRLKLIQALGDPYQMLEQKMVRRYGHFHRARPSGAKYCVDSYFDGRWCENEVTSLFASSVDQIVNAIDRSKLLVLYKAPLSPWLESSVLAVCTKLALSSANLAITSTNELSLKNYEHIILVVDMVDTGESMQRLIGEFNSVGFDGNLHLQTVLTTNSNDRQRRRRTIKCGGKDYFVEYYLQVDPNKFDVDKCPLCRLKIPHSNEVLGEDEAETHMLTTYTMWSLTLLGGVGPEQNHPSYRPPLTTVPKLPEMILMNGAWIVTKILDYLHASPKSFPIDPIIICPDERGSLVLTDYMRIVSGISVIRVPRPAINLCESDEANVSELITRWENEDQAWLTDIKQSRNAQFIVMDEFNLSGRTLKGVRKLLNAFSKTIHCYFPLVDMNPQLSRTIKDIPTYCLYEWQAINNTDVQYGQAP